MDVISTSDGSSTAASTSTTVPNSNGQEQGQNSTSANGLSARTTTTHGRTAHRSPSTSSYTSTTSAASSKKTRSLRPPTWRAGSMRVGKTASATQLRTSSSGSFDTSPRAKPVTSASESSVSLVNAESFPSFNSDEALDTEEAYRTARPRERRRMDSSASVASLSMHITNSPNWNGTVEGKGKGKMTYGHGAAGRGRGDGGRKLMELFEEQDLQVTDSLSPAPDPLTASTSTGSGKSKGSAGSDAPTTTVTDTGPMNGGGPVHTTVLSPNASAATSRPDPAVISPTNDESNASTATVITSNRLEPIDLSEPNYSSTSTNQLEAYSDYPTTSSNLTPTNDHSSNTNALAPLSSTLSTSPTNTATISVNDAPLASSSQVQIPHELDQVLTTPADTSTGETVSSSTSWLGSLGRAMGRRTQAYPNESGKEQSETERRIRVVQDHLKDAYSTSVSESNSADHHSSTATQSTQSVDLGTETVVVRTRARGSGDLQSAKTRPKTWFFSQSPTPPETETTTISGSTTNVAGNGNKDAVSALIASTSRSQSPSKTPDGRTSPPPSASTAGSSSFPSSPLISSSIPSSIDDEVPIPRLMLSKVTLSPQELEEMNQMIGGAEGGLTLGLSTIKPRALQRLGVVSMHSQMGLEDQPLVGAIKGRSSPLTGLASGNVDGSEGEDNSRNASMEEAPVPVGNEVETGKDSDNVSPNSTPRPSPRPPRQRINSMNSLNPSTSRFSIVGVPLTFWRAPSPNSGRSEEENKKSMEPKSHADTKPIPSTSNTTSSATSTSTATSSVTASINTTPNTISTSISTPHSRSSPPLPSTLSSKSGPVTSLSTDAITAAASTNDVSDAKDKLTRAGNVIMNEEPIHAESREEESMIEGRKAEEEPTDTTTPKDPVATDTTTSDSTTKTATQQQQNTTYAGSWWDYVGWGGSSGTSQDEAQSTSETVKGNVSESPVEAVEQDSQGVDNSHEPAAQPVSELEASVPSTVPNTITPSDATPEPAPAQSQPSLLEPTPPDADVSSTTGMKSAPPTVLAEESQPQRPASVFSGETVRSGAGSWLAPWTWYGGSGSTSAPPTAAASSTSIDKVSKLKRQMTESEKVKEEALAREREREADAEPEKDSEQDQNVTKDIGTSDQPVTATAADGEATALTLPEGEQSASSPPAANQPTHTSLTSISSAPSGWASFFSIGKGKETSIKQPQDGNDVQDDSEVKRDENGIEIMDLDDDEEAAPRSQSDDVPGVAISEGKTDSSVAVQSKEVVKKESIKEILKAGATSPERKVTLVKALLQSSSPRPASILSSLSSSPTKASHSTPDSPTKASAKSDQGKLLANVPRDQIHIKSRGRTDSIITTATSASNASSVAKRAPLLVVSDDVKANAATKSPRSSSRGGNEKEKDGSASGAEVSDGKEKSEKAKTKVEKKASKDPVKDKDKKHVKSKSNSGSSTPVPPAPPNLVLPTWSDTFYTSPRSHLPSGVLPLTPLPGTEAYEVMSTKDEQKSLSSTIGRTMKFVSGVLFSGDRRTGHGERRTSSLSGGSTALASRRGSESSTPVLEAGKRAASPPVSGGLVSPRIAALRAGSSKGKAGSSLRLGSTESQTLKQKEAMVDVERMKQKEKLYWDWGRGLPRSWEVVQFGHPIGLEKDNTEGLLEGGEDLKPEKAKAEQIDGHVPEPAKVVIPGMGLEPGTTLSLTANILEGYKNKGKGKVTPEASTVDDVLKGCRKVVVIGIHGWFPGAVMRSVLGEPTGTSPKFVNMMVQALEEFQERHGVRLERITKIPLEGEGTIDKRVEKLYTNLLSNQEWMDDLHNADAIFVATHSQGSVVSTHLLDRLIRERHIRTSKNGASEPIPDIGVNMIPLPPQRVCCLALCGIHLGPLRYLSTSSLLQPYIQYFESTAARELFEFQNTENDVSKSYVNALRNVVDNGTKMVYVASLNDQVVPIYSGLFTSASHPLILRALYIDGDAYNSSDFLSNLLVLLLRVLNTGLSDSGLLAHLSEVTAGSLNGVGHSTAYEELATFSLAVDYLFLTNDGFEEHPELTLDPFNAASEMNDYEIPWALRDLIADERVAHFFSREITDLRNAFRDWNPKTSILRDIKRKLQPIQRLPSTLAPGSANSTSKL